MSGEERYEGNVQREVVEGEKTATGVQKEHLGTGRAAQSEAGKKGGEIFKEPGAGIMADPAGREGKKKGGVKATKEGIQEEE